MTNMQVVLVLLKHSSHTMVSGQEEEEVVVSVMLEGEPVLESVGAALAPASKLKSATVSLIVKKHS